VVEGDDVKDVAFDAVREAIEPVATRAIPMLFRPASGMLKDLADSGVILLEQFKTQPVPLLLMPSNCRE
jgi:hypothetical protein